MVAALAPVAERLARRPQTPTNATPACAVAVGRALADDAVAAVVARTPDAEAHNTVVANAKAHSALTVAAALAPVAELSRAPSVNAPGRRVRPTSASQCHPSRRSHRFGERRRQTG